MPTYNYKCDNCDYSFETLQSIIAPKLKICPKCKKRTLNRLIGIGSGIIFKGDGFYCNMYPKIKQGENEDGI